MAHGIEGLNVCQSINKINFFVLQEKKIFTWKVSDCEKLVEDLFRVERGNDLQRDLREMMRLVEL